jgi:hypothetical protein
MLTNHPVRKLGRQLFRRIPFAHFRDVEADALLSLERDLRFVPTPVSGGMRKGPGEGAGPPECASVRGAPPLIGGLI